MNAKDSIIWEQYVSNKIRVYLLIEGIIFSIILCFNIISGEYQIIAEYYKIIYVLTGLIFLITQKEYVKNPEMVCAVALTMVADFFLVFSRQYIYGVITFIIVQVFFSKRIADYMKVSLFKMTRSVIILALIESIILIPVFSSNRLFYALIILYIVLFGINIINMLKCYMYVADDNSKKFLSGLFLFLLCDINVALYNLELVFKNINWPVLEYFGYFLWLFYLPSQMLLVLSSIYKDG